MSRTTETERPWGHSPDAHLYVEVTDEESAGNDFERKLHVCPALPNGVHVSVSIRGVRGTALKRSAGINLTPAEALALVEHITKVLAHGGWDAGEAA